MQAEDWSTEQKYHIDKREFHRQLLYSPGVLSGYKENLKVTVSSLSAALEVAPGYAVDSEGHDLYLSEKRTVTIPPMDSDKSGQYFYVAISFSTKKLDKRDDPANPNPSPYTYVEEDTDVTISPTAPDNKQFIELARFQFPQKDSSTNDLAALKMDLSHVPQAWPRTRETEKKLTINDFADKIMDTSIQVRASSRRQDGTGVLLDKTPLDALQPMYIVSVISTDGAPTSWSIHSITNPQTIDYTLHISNDSNHTTTVVCRVFKVRL